MAAGGSSAKVGTVYEQLIGKLMDGEGNPGKESMAVAAWAAGSGRVLTGQEAERALSRISCIKHA